jgi:hypothetical protein
MPCRPARSPFDKLRAQAVGDVADRILGGWLGRIAGCNLGKPIENGDFWTPERIRSYLELADAYPLRDYIPALDPMPEGFPAQRKLAGDNAWPGATVRRATTTSTIRS